MNSQDQAALNAEAMACGLPIDWVDSAIRLAKAAVGGKATGEVQVQATVMHILLRHIERLEAESGVIPPGDAPEMERARRVRATAEGIVDMVDAFSGELEECGERDQYVRRAIFQINRLISGLPVLPMHGGWPGNVWPGDVA